MVDLQSLRVSLTKNGYMKIATLVRQHPSHEILANVRGTHHGINLARSQVKNILSADEAGNVPSYWDEIRNFSPSVVQGFVFLAVVFSHVRMIEALRAASNGSPTGTLRRADLTDKVYTNLARALADLGASQLRRGAAELRYDLRDLLRTMGPARRQVEQLLRDKLKRCGWRDPNLYAGSHDLLFFDECRRQGFDQALGMSNNEFRSWLGYAPSRPR